MKNDILSQPPGPSEQMGTLGICPHFFDRSKIKIRGAYDYALQHKGLALLSLKTFRLVWSLLCPSFAYLASFSLSSGQRLESAYGHPGQAKLPRSAFLAQDVAAEYPKKTVAVACAN